MRKVDAGAARKVKGARWRTYTVNEALRAVFAGDLTLDEVGELLSRVYSKASRSRLKLFVTLA